MGFPHHSGESQRPSDPARELEIANLMNRFTEQVEGRAKRAYSQGRLNGDDLGDLACAIATDTERKRIVMDFGKQVTWLAMTADDAVSLAKELLKRARTITDKPIILEV